MPVLHALSPELDKALADLPGTSSTPCNGPGGLNCATWSDPACQHLVVLVGTSTGLTTGLKRYAQRLAARGGDYAIVPLLPPGAPAKGIPDNWQILRHAGDDAVVAANILRAAGIARDRPLFLSYVRSDAQALVDDLADVLTRRGFRLYVDRFSAQPGTRFPEEIAEALTDAGAMLLIESAGLPRSRWTQWEIALAAHCRIGRIALTIPQAPQSPGIRAHDRHALPPLLPNGSLSPADLDVAADFVTKRYNIAAMVRAAEYRALVDRLISLRYHGLTTSKLKSGVLGLRPDTALLATGRPGAASEARMLDEAAPHHRHRILLGQHRYMNVDRRRDLAWLAGKANLKLRQPGDLPVMLANLAAGTAP
nr:toll/interleukin-1 receptor domain-containing protein [Sphingomonas chungangi]